MNLTSTKKIIFQAVEDRTQGGHARGWRRPGIPSPSARTYGRSGSSPARLEGGGTGLWMARILLPIMNNLVRSGGAVTRFVQIVPRSRQDDRPQAQQLQGIVAQTYGSWARE